MSKASREKPTLPLPFLAAGSLVLPPAHSSTVPGVPWGWCGAVVRCRVRGAGGGRRAVPGAGSAGAAHGGHPGEGHGGDLAEGRLRLGTRSDGFLMPGECWPCERNYMRASLISPKSSPEASRHPPGPLPWYPQLRPALLHWQRPLVHPKPCPWLSQVASVCLSFPSWKMGAAAPTSLCSALPAPGWFYSTLGVP